jgi:protein-disulfide isomerase
MPLRRAWLLIALLVAVACGPEAPPRMSDFDPILPQQPRATSLVASAPARLLSEQSPNPRALGDPHAPIVVVEYGDFQCPFCLGFVQTTKPLIDEHYIKTGKVYFIFQDLPLTTIHPGALMAAHAANCAAEQGRFWEMHDRLYAGLAANEWGSGTKSDLQTFGDYAESIGLSGDALQTCVASSRHARQIESDVRAASGRGLDSTPTFLINGRIMVGAPSFERWQEIFDTILAGE